MVIEPRQQEQNTSGALTRRCILFFILFFKKKKGQIKNDSYLPRVIPICLSMVRRDSMGKQEPQFI
jgi:hypothetical protein